MLELIFPALLNLIRAKRSSSSLSGMFLLRYISHGVWVLSAFLVPCGYCFGTCLCSSFVVGIAVGKFSKTTANEHSSCQIKQGDGGCFNKEVNDVYFGKFTKVAMLRQQQC